LGIASGKYRIVDRRVKLRHGLDELRGPNREGMSQLHDID
jgi:hypothetical protein